MIYRCTERYVEGHADWRALRGTFETIFRTSAKWSATARPVGGDALSRANWAYDQPHVTSGILDYLIAFPESALLEALRVRLKQKGPPTGGPPGIPGQ